MKLNGKNGEAAMAGVKSVLVAVVSFAAMAIVLGCDSDAGQGGGGLARVKARSVEVTQVPVRHSSWGEVGRVTEDPSVELMKRIVAGDVAGVDEMLSRGVIGIDDVICDGRAICNRRAIDLSQVFLTPPEIVAQLFQKDWAIVNPYTIRARLNGLLQENEGCDFYGTPLMTAARAGRAEVVAFLLKRGAKPNVFIRVKGVDGQVDGRTRMARIGVGDSEFISGKRPFAVLCALTDCYVYAVGKYADAADECAEILLKHGAVMPPVNSMGQTALWAAAQARSRFLLDQFVKMGADVNHKDDLGMTVADYVSREMASLPVGRLRQEYEAFLSALQGYGAKVSNGGAKYPSNNNTTGSQISQIPQPSTRTAPQQDHSAEIAAIEAQLKDLRMQLIDAKHDANMGAITGTASVSAQMRVMSLIDAIHERERRLSALQGR